MARLYSNENFPLAAVEALRALGHDVLTTLEADEANLGVPDEEVLEFAIQAKRAIVTLNRRDFIRLHRLTDGAHCGSIVCTQDRDVEALARRISAKIRSESKLYGALIRVNRGELRG